MIRFIRACEREVSAFPQEVREELSDTLARLDEGHRLSMPLSRPMPAIGSGVHELRFRDRSGIFRVVYAMLRQHEVLVVHGFQKKNQKTPLRAIQISKQRIREDAR